MPFPYLWANAQCLWVTFISQSSANGQIENPKIWRTLSYIISESLFYKMDMNEFLSAFCQDSKLSIHDICRFLGYFQPQDGKPALWELDSDYYLHVSGIGDDLVPDR